MPKPPPRKPKAEPETKPERLDKRVVQKPDGRYLILYEPRERRDADR